MHTHIDVIFMKRIVNNLVILKVGGKNYVEAMARNMAAIDLRPGNFCAGSGSTGNGEVYARF
jgi:hypothetical protein